jgi:hypothetical protein
MNRECATGLLAIVLLSAAMPASAQAEVEKRLDDLERRVKALETVQPMQRTPSTTRSAWRKLAKGMSPEQVRVLLGEPDHIDGGPLEQWRWKSGGNVMFMDGQLQRWSEPR